MRMLISLESRQRIDADSRSEQMHLTFNPEELMTLIRETHLTNVACGAVRDKAMEASLDESRHRDMCVSIENQRKLGIARPANLAITYATASSWKSTTVATGSNATDFNAVYLCTDDVPAVSVMIVPPARKEDSLQFCCYNCYRESYSCN